MNVIGYLLLGIFIWFVFNLLVKVVLPVYRTTKKLRKQFRDLANQHNQHQQESQSQQYQQYQQPTKPTQPKEGEYIDFEEVK